jgi:LPXTG-motif cell wall-anchored protein
MKKVIAWIALGLGIIAAGFFFYFKKNKLRDFEPQMKARISRPRKTGFWWFI